MKHFNQSTLQNAFLKVAVNGSYQRLFLRDVKMYKKLLKRRNPPLPNFSGEPTRQKSDMES